MQVHVLFGWMKHYVSNTNTYFQAQIFELINSLIKDLASVAVAGLQ